MDIQAINRQRDRQNGPYSNCVDTGYDMDAIIQTWDTL